MRVALLTVFHASRKEPLAEALERIHQAFLTAGLTPAIQFSFNDGPLGGVSSVDRVLKRHPELAQFVTSAAPAPGIPGVRRISNGPLSPGAGAAIPYETLHEIAAGVPRSFPFHHVAIHFESPEFGTLPAGIVRSAEMMPGVVLGDDWWVNGRTRSLSACVVVDADPGNRKLPPAPEKVAQVLKACGKARRTVQAPVGDPGMAPIPAVRLPTGMMMASANPEAARAVQPIVMNYRARMAEIVEQAGLPHDLPPAGEAARSDAATGPGPRKPALEQAFNPMGYDCRGGSGTFRLQRRTAGNLTVELSLDVGTWITGVLAMFKVWGLGFKAALMLPVGKRMLPGGQYPVNSPEVWQQVVDNLAALVRELDRTFVPEIEAAAGPSPEWYRPDE